MLRKFTSVKESSIVGITTALVISVDLVHAELLVGVGRNLGQLQLKHHTSTKNQTWPARRVNPTMTFVVIVRAVVVVVVVVMAYLALRSTGLTIKSSVCKADEAKAKVKEEEEEEECHNIDAQGVATATR
eukprot:scaffold1982_cov93-Amphora_coffeaeformis.AAC.60